MDLDPPLPEIPPIAEARAAPVAPRPCCPVCGAEAIGQRCKLVCPRCHAVVENCSGD